MDNEQVNGCQISLHFELSFDELARLFDNNDFTPEAIRNLWDNGELQDHIEERIGNSQLLAAANDVEIDVGSGYL